MSTYYADYPTGREVVAEAQEYPFYAQHPTATARFLEYAEERFEYRDPSELDLSSHRKIFDLARGGFYRPYGMADITGAEAAGVVAYTVANGMLILLEAPGGAKVESEYLGTMEGREARAGEPRHDDRVGDAAGRALGAGAVKKKGAFTAYADSWLPLYERLGPEVVGPQPVLAKRPRAVGADGWMRHMPVAPPMFTGPGPESVERHEEGERRRRVDAILKKYGSGKQTGPIGWRL